MNYRISIEINLPRKELVALFDNPDNIFKRQPQLQSYTPIIGTPGKEGAQAKLIYAMDGKETEMIETILKRNLPDEFLCSYEAHNSNSIIENKFEIVRENQTRWIYNVEIQFKGIVKYIAPLLKGGLKAHATKNMELFKTFAEAQRTV